MNVLERGKTFALLVLCISEPKIAKLEHSAIRGQLHSCAAFVACYGMVRLGQLRLYYMLEVSFRVVQE